MRFAVISGLWYGSEITPVPKRIERVRSAATAMNSSGELISLPAGGMVLADPGLVEAEPVQPLHELEIAVHAGGGILVHRMERRQEDAVAELDWGHGRPLELNCGIVRGMLRRLKVDIERRALIQQLSLADGRQKRGSHGEPRGPRDNRASREALRFFFLSAFSVVLGALRVNPFSSFISDSPKPDA